MITASGRTRRLSIAFVLAAVVLTLLPGVHDLGQQAAAAAAWRTGSTVHSVRVDGVRRTYRVYRPAGLPAAAPLVVFLHPGFGNARQAASDYHWNEVADAEKAVIAYPDGVGSTWNAGGCCGSAQRRDVDDVAFVTALVEQVRGNIGIDRDRIYAAGFSNGGFMTERLACDIGLFAAVAEVAGTRVAESCAPAAATAPSVLYVHGLQDTNVRWDGEPGSGRAAVDGAPREDSLAHWRTVLGGCSAPSRVVQQVGSTEVVRRTWACDADRAVAALTLSDAGHQYPGAVRRPLVERRFSLPPPSTAIDATAEIWDFFAAHPRRS